MPGSFLTVPLYMTPAVTLLMVVRMSEDRLTPTPGMQGRDERQATTTLDELKGIVLDGFGRALGDIATTNQNLRAIDVKVGDVIARVDRLETRVFGSKPPPLEPRPAIIVHGVPSVLPGTSAPPGEHRERSPSLVEKTEANAGEVAELAGRMLAVESKLGAVEKKADTAISINKQQSRAMGLAMPEAPPWRKAAALLFSRKGVELVIALLTFGAVALGYDRATDALQRVQKTIEHLPAEVAPR